MSKTSVSRRRFMQTTGAAAVGVPMIVGGRARAEMGRVSAANAMEVGVSKWDLDTPSLCVDLDGLEANLATMQQTLTRNGIASRPHAKTHKCPAIARCSHVVIATFEPLCGKETVEVLGWQKHVFAVCG
jgi:3-hydroxy-D-aspartate aldolase